LAVKLKPGEPERLARVPTENLEAYSLYLRARTRIWPPTRGNILAAQFAYANVIELDPKFAGGYAGKSIAHAMAVLFGPSDAPKSDAAEAMALAKLAIGLDEGFARAHSALGSAHTASRQHAEAVVAARRAVELQPGDADSHAFYARCLMWSGAGDEAAEAVRTALRLDPQYIEGPYLNLLGRALFVAGRYGESIEAFERNRARGGPAGGAGGSLLTWVAAYAFVGRIVEARALAQEFLRYLPNFSLARLLDKPEMLCVGERGPLVEGLRKLGLPE
jgi:adenylate cyclase